MGVYKRLQEVPERYRLQQYRSIYHDRDVWAEWVTERTAQHDGLSQYLTDRMRITERSWKDHTAACNRHHALASPEEVESWIATFMNGCWNIRTVYEGYWVHLAHFYRWLRFHTDHPHVYDPVLMAAATGPETNRVWECKVQGLEDRHDTK